MRTALTTIILLLATTTLACPVARAADGTLLDEYQNLDNSLVPEGWTLGLISGNAASGVADGRLWALTTDGHVYLRRPIAPGELGGWLYLSMTGNLNADGYDMQKRFEFYTADGAHYIVGFGTGTGNDANYCYVWRDGESNLAGVTIPRASGDCYFTFTLTDGAIDATGGGMTIHASDSRLRVDDVVAVEFHTHTTYSTTGGYDSWIDDLRLLGVPPVTPARPSTWGAVKALYR